MKNKYDKKDIGFIVNIPKYVPVNEDNMSDTSSAFLLSNEDDILARLQEFDDINLPYVTHTIKAEKVQEKDQEKNKAKDKRIAGTSKINDITAQLNPNNDTTSAVQPLFNLIQQNGFEPQEQNHQNQLSVAVGFNRPLSLSTRKNNILKKEAEKEINTDLEHTKIAFFWEVKWFDGYSKNTDVEYEDVRRFYKELKYITKNTQFDDDTKAKAQGLIDALLLQEEGGSLSPTPPYQNIREYLKNHEKTKELVSSANTKYQTLYFSLIDSDVVNFNGIYSAYLRIVKSSEHLPIIMSTGYEFYGVGADYAYRFASHIDRLIRVSTASKFPAGVYYPEPNMLVLLPDDSETLPYSFLDRQSYPNANMESPILIRNALNADSSRKMVFADDSPLIIEIPERAKYSSVQKRICGEKRKFSENFQEDLIANPEDLKHFADITQSVLDPMNWAKGLCYNRAFKISGLRGVSGKFRKCMIEIRDNRNLKLFAEEVAGRMDIDPISVVPDLKEAALAAAKTKNLLVQNCGLDFDMIDDCVSTYDLIFQICQLSLQETQKLGTLFGNSCDKHKKIYYFLINHSMFLKNILEMPEHFFDEKLEDVYLKYQDEITLDDLIEIAKTNPDLYIALMNDHKSLLDQISVEEFIEKFEDAQSKIGNISLEELNDNEYEEENNPYDMVENVMIDEYGYDYADESDSNDDIDSLIFEYATDNNMQNDDEASVCSSISQENCASVVLPLTVTVNVDIELGGLTQATLNLCD